MNWVVVINSTTLQGQALLKLNRHDHLYEGHPVLLCESADISHQQWLRVETRNNQGKGYVYLPHSSILMIAEGPNSGREFGFRPTQE